MRRRGGLALVLVVVGCEEAPGPGPVDPGGPSGTPQITLTAPLDGAGSYGGAFDVAWEVDGLVLDEDIGGQPRDGHGHVHLYVNDMLVEESAALGASIDGLGAGAHTIRVRLAANDHTELAATDEVEVDVRTPSLRILAPVDGEVLTASSTPLTLAVEDFDLSGGVGFGEGSFRILVDGDLRDWGTDPLTAVATGLVEGRSTVTVQLVDGEGKPLDPPVEDEVEVEVPLGARGVYWDRAAFATAFDSATVPLSLSTTAFTLFDRELYRPPADGEGHLHLFMDGEWLDATAEPSRVLQNVAAGPHLFEARLVTNDGFELPILDRMWIFVAEDRPDVAVSFPGPDWVMGPAFDLQFTAENFTLDATATTPARHLGVARVFVDNVLFTETDDTLVPLSGLLPGTRQLRIELADVDRLPLNPAVYAEFPVVVE